MRIRVADYFYVTVTGHLGEGFEVLSALADAGVNLMAVNAVPLGPEAIQFAIFPERSGPLVQAASRLGLCLVGPQRAVLVQGEDELGVIARLHAKLRDGGLQPYASAGVTDGRGDFGYVLYFKPQDVERAAQVLGAS
jgi:hypothetical protein